MIVALDRDVNPNWRVMQFTPSVAIMVGAAILSTPADKRARFGPALKGGAGVHPKRRFSFADAMAVMQAALSVVLLIAAGLFLRSLHSLRSVDLGFDPGLRRSPKLLVSAQDPGAW